MKRKPIKLLKKNVSNLVAAGEVVTSPFSVIKELVENSLDAEASKIEVNIKDGGKTYISVLDNGIGILEDEIENAFIKSATSKIENEDDLYNINTFGFRGEALFSIKLVSKLTITTKTESDDLGVKVLYEDGKEVKRGKVSFENGTLIEISDLFWNTPARKKFLKSDIIETSKILSFLKSMAILHSNIKFKFVSNEKVIFSTSGKSDIETNIRVLLGENSKLIELKENKIFGYISPPDNLKKTSAMQVFSVNGRIIESSFIKKTIKEIYKNRIFKTGHPLVFFNLSLPNNLIDVNIHPAKTEIKFKDEESIKKFLTEVIGNALNSKQGIFSGGTEKVEKINDNKNFNNEEKIRENIKEFLAKKNEEKSEEIVFSHNYANETDDGEAHNDNSRKIEVNEKLFTEFNIENLEIIGQVFGGYILANDFNSFFIIDQHAAHERINYERLLKNFSEQNFKKQMLLVPEIIRVGSITGDEMKSKISLLEKYGFDVDVFGENEIKIEGIPLISENFDAITFGAEISKYSDSDTLSEIAAMKACKASIKANENLSKEKIKILLQNLSKTDNPYSCPHGRPVFIKYEKKDIEKLFKRI